MNQIISCLAGGRNKMMAARAYDFYNAELVDSGLSVRVPETINNVTRGEIPLWIHSMGGHAVLKVPYSNAGTNNSPLWQKKKPSNKVAFSNEADTFSLFTGQGVYTITNPNELKEFLEQDHHYDKVTSHISSFFFSHTQAIDFKSLFPLTRFA